MANTEAKDAISEVKKPGLDTKATGVDLSNQTDSQLAAQKPDSKKATDLLPAVEIVGQTKETPESTTKAIEANVPPVEKVNLSGDALNASVDLVKDKLTNYLYLIGSPDTDALARTLGPMTASDREALETKYQEKFGTSLREELKYQLGTGEKFVTIEAMLNRKDDQSNLAGNARIAVEVMKEDPARGMRLLRSTIGPLLSTQTAELQANYEKDYGHSLASDIDSSQVGENQKAIFNTLLKGTDQNDSEAIAGMARKAVQAHDLQMFAGVIAGDMPAAIDARRALNSDPEFVASMRKAFGTTARGQGLQLNPIAEDYLREGNISLGTILKADTAAILPYFQNAANSDLVFSNATANERRAYIAGKELTQTGAEPKTIQEQEAKRYYDFIEKNIQSSASGTRQDVLRDELLNGGKTLISGLAELHKDSTFGFGGGHNTNDLMNRVENMSAAEWNLLKNPAYKANLAESLKSYASEDEQKQVMALVEAKLIPPGVENGQQATFEQSQKVQRSLEQYMQNYTTSGATKTSEAVGHIEHMTEADAARYKGDPAFKASVDSFASQYLTDQSSGNVPAQLLTSRLLEQTAQTGKPPVLGEIDNFLKGRAEQTDSDTLLDGPAANKAQLATIGKVEELMKDPALLARMQNVLAVQRGEKQGEVSKEDDLLYKTFSATLGTPGNFAYLLTDGQGQSYIGTKVALSGGLAGDWIVGHYPDLAKLPEADRTRIRESLPQAEQQVLDNVIAQGGQAQLSDKLRSLVIDGGSLQDFQADLAKLGSEQQAQLKAEYTRKYGGELDQDLLASITQRDGLSTEQQQVLKNTIAQNGQPQLVDDLRSFVLGNDKKFQDFQSQLAGLSQPQKQELKSEYQKRYGGTLDNDFLSKVDSAHSEQYSRYLTASSTDGMQSFFDRMNKFAPLTVGDGTSLGQERMLQVNENVLKQFNSNMEKLPQPVQEALAEYYSKTYQNNLDSNEKYAHFVADVTLTAASIAAAIALAGPTGGISMAALATREGATLAAKLVVAGATAGAIARPTMIAAMENGTFDYSASNLAKEGLIGAVQGAMIAPIGFAGKVTVAANDAKIATALVAKDMAQEVTEEVAESAVTQRVAANALEQKTIEQAAAPIVESKVVTEVAQPVAAPIIESKVVTEVAQPVAAPIIESKIVTEVAQPVAAAVTETKVAPNVIRPVASETASKEVVEQFTLPAIENNVAKKVIEEVPTAAIDPTLAKEVAAINPTKVVAGENAVEVEAASAASTVDTTLAKEVAAINPTKIVAADDAIKPAITPLIEGKTASEGLEATVAERAAAERAATEKAAAEQATKQTVLPLVPPVVARTVIPELVPDIELEPKPKTQTDLVPAIELEPKPEVQEKEVTPEHVALQPSDNLIKLATVRRGEGPWQSAERILATDGKVHSVAEVRALTRAIQATFKDDNNGNGDMSGLKVKYNFVTANNYEALVNAVKDENVKKLLLGLANQTEPSTAS
ncbi:hypothetical protein BH11CYA1_BH11CYA1_21050 [soil metagenome]